MLRRPRWPVKRRHKSKRPGLFAGALQSVNQLRLFAGSAELRGDCGEGGLELRTQRVDDGDDDDRNAGGNQAVFDRGRAGHVVGKTLHEIGNGVLLFCYCLRSVPAGARPSPGQLNLRNSRRPPFPLR
jgi:hypothetical protein